MSNVKNSTFEYDEDDSVKFIRESLPEEMRNEFSDDDINYIVDLIYEFYEEKGFLEEDNNDEFVEFDEDELIEYVAKNVKKDDIRKYTDEQILKIVEGEMAYCESLNLFDK